MKQGRTLQEFAAEIERQAESKADFVLDTRRMQVETLSTATARPTTRIILDDAGEDGGLGEFSLTDHAHTQVAERLGIPKVFYDRLRFGHTPKRGARKLPQPGVFDTLVNGLFQNAPEKRMVRTLDGKARAYLSNRYRPFDNIDLASHVLPIIAEWASNQEAELASCELTENRLYIKVVLPKIQLDIGSAEVGDIVQSGFVIQNSEVGLGSLAVYPMVYRLVCKNGMIREAEGMRKYHVGRAADQEGALDVFRNETLRQDDKAFWMKVTDVVRASADAAVFEGIVGRMREAKDSTRINDPVGAVERIANTFQLQEKEQKSILSHLIEGGDLSAFGALNAVTRASQDVADYDRATELEKIGGAFLDLSRAEWEKLALTPA